MPLKLNKLYYFSLVVQSVIVLFFMMGAKCKDCNIFYMDRINDYKKCSETIDSFVRERRLIEAAKDKQRDSVEHYKSYMKYEKEVYFHDTVKVSYVGQDGVQVVTKYPFHKTIVD